MTKTARESALWAIRKLKPHPRQAATFPDLGEADLAALAADMQKNGLQHPVEVLPDGTVLGGHQRVRAAKRLGWKTIEVVVRHDLAAAGEPAATAYFITDNLNRRHLSPLGKARCMCSLVEAEAGRKIDDLYWEDKDGVKAAVAERLGMSARNLNRYLLILKAPPPVQAAFERGDVSLTEAGRVALLGRAAAAVGDAVAAVYAGHPDAPPGDASVRRQVRAALEGGSGRDAGGVKAAFYRLVRALRRELPAVRAGMSGIDPDALARLRDVVGEAHAVFAALKTRAG